jgi:hypothetical protein
MHFRRRFWFKNRIVGVEVYRMTSHTRLLLTVLTVAVFCSVAVLVPLAHAQQTLGGLTGTVTDISGASVPATTVTIVSDQTKLTRTAETNETGVYSFVDLPIGSYTVTFTHAGFLTTNVPSVQVQANRTVTINAAMKIGEVTQTVTVVETPLVNAVDTTNGYVMDKTEIDEIPLPTGSFTGLAIHSVGVNAELPGGSGANAGMGNAPVWANGQRDTSNTFLLNGVDAASLFNGKTTSGVLSARVVNNTGLANPLELSALPEQSSGSVYLAIGESLPSPAPESITEVRVNTSMYDAQQGSTSGAHIDLSTASGTNNIHGSLYGHRSFGGLDADPFFYNADPNIPPNEKNPILHRSTLGGTVGFPIKKNKVFLFLSYQHMHAADQEIGISRAIVPTSLTKDRSPTGLADAANAVASSGDNCILPEIGTQQNIMTLCNGSVQPSNQINPIAFTLLNYPAAAPCAYLIPCANQNSVTANPGLYSSNPAVQSALQEAFPEDVEIPGQALFKADQGVADLDYNMNSAHSFFVKYYYQNDPTTAPYAYSMYPGFAQHLAAGSQVISLSHTQIVKSNLSITETFGFVRERAYSSISQPFTPSQFANECTKLTGASLADCTINTFGSNTFPGLSVVYAAPAPGPLSYADSMELGATAQYQGADTGVFQNRFNPSANAIWTLGKHTVTFGGSFAYTQLNTIDNRNTFGTIAAFDFADLVGGTLTPNYFYNVTSLPVGNLSRYWRSNESGEYIQDKFLFRPNLSITAGLRWDWDGGLSEKYGNLLNFDPSLYNYNPTTDTVVNNGLIVAGNNKEAGTPGVSNTTLTGRQWGFAPRIGVAWSPKRFNDKIVVRAGWGMYYDRGELFTYLSPAFTYNIDTGGAFGVNETQPFAVIQTCGQTVACAANGGVPTLENPWGSMADLATATTLASGNPAKIQLPNATALINGATPFYLADYARNNKLPYTMNATVDVQWQPRNDLAIDIGYVNALGRHEVIPIPFNQSRIATPTNPLCGPTPTCTAANAMWPQSYTYGYTVQSANCPDYSQFANNCPINLPNGQPMLSLLNEGGNGDLRSPYIGFADESESYVAEGVSNYNALQAHIEKRLSHGLSLGASYTFSRSMDEQSALGLFYNGDNPFNLKSAYGLSDFDRPNVINIDYHYQLPTFVAGHSFKSQIVDGWAVQGVVIVQNGQPYSIIDYSGAVGSIYYSLYNGITNPIVPLAPGCTPQNAVTGANGVTPGVPALNPACFSVQTLAPGALNGAIPPGDTFEDNFTTGQRNIFRQPWQKRADISIVKMTKLTERLNLRYSFDVYNLTNTPSFDIPIDNVSQNESFIQYPYEGEPGAPGAALCKADNNTAGPFATENLYNCPSGVGQVTKTIGSSRQVQMSLGLTF